MNLILGSSGKIGSYYMILSKIKNNFYTSRKGFKSKYSKFNFTKDSINKLYKKIKFQNCVIFSSISDPSVCVNKSIYSHKVNVIKMRKLIDFFIKKNIYFIFFSSEYIYSGTNAIYTESSITKTKMIYGKQKIAVENYIKKRKYQNCLILRISKVYGYKLNDKTLFTSFIRKYKNGNLQFNVADDQYFKPLYIKDLIKIIDLSLDKKIRGTYNVCGSNFSSRYLLLKKFCFYLKLKNIKIIKDKLDNYDHGIFFPKKLNLSNSKIVKKLKFKFTNLEESFYEIQKNI